MSAEKSFFEFELFFIFIFILRFDHSFSYVLYLFCSLPFLFLFYGGIRLGLVVCQLGIELSPFVCLVFIRSGGSKSHGYGLLTRLENAETAI